MAVTFIHEGKRVLYWIGRSPMKKNKIVEGLGFANYSSLNAHTSKERVNLAFLKKFCIVIGITVDQFYDIDNKTVSQQKNALIHSDLKMFDEYLKDIGVRDCVQLINNFPAI